MTLKVYDYHQTLFWRLWDAASLVTVLGETLTSYETDADGLLVYCESEGCINESEFTAEDMATAVIEGNVATIHDSADDSTVTVKFFKTVPLVIDEIVTVHKTADLVAEDMQR